MPFYIPNETAEGIAIGASNWDNMLGNIMQLQKQQNADRAAMRSRQAQRTEELENDALYMNSGGGGRGGSHSGSGGYSGQGGGAYISPSNTIDPNTNSTPNERLRDKNAPILAEKVDENGNAIGEGNPYTVPQIMPAAVGRAWEEVEGEIRDPAFAAKYANTPYINGTPAERAAYIQQYGAQIYRDQAAAIANTPPIPLYDENGQPKVDSKGNQLYKTLTAPAFLSRMASGDPRSNEAKRMAIEQLRGR